VAYALALRVAVTKDICAIIMRTPCVVNAQSPKPLFLALQVFGISVSLDRSLVAGGRGGVLTGCWFREQLQCFMYRASGQNKDTVMGLFGEYVIRIT
jgi:hypothetical protein